MAETDKVFSGSIAALYETHMVPMLFAPYAADIAARVVATAPTDVLETAAGTGAVTAELLRRLPRGTRITSTDLNQAMLDVAALKLPPNAVHWQACDALQLPFAPESFDAVVCQFGAMFFPDKSVAYREARRVLRAGGLFALSVWDDIESSPFAAVVLGSVAAGFPDNPPNFLRRTPHGYHDTAAITATLGEAGFGKVRAETLTLACRAPSAEYVAVAFCQGTPLRGEIEQRAPERLAEVTEEAARAVARAFGTGPLESTMRAVVFEARA
jgi:ubiquinone/menaquinone biosynthesis C-methylase UbiE